MDTFEGCAIDVDSKCVFTFDQSFIEVYGVDAVVPGFIRAAAVIE